MSEKYKNATLRLCLGISRQWMSFSNSPISLWGRLICSGSEVTVIGLLSSPTSVVFMFALPLPLPVYLGFLGIPVICQKRAVLINLFAVNDMKFLGYFHLFIVATGCPSERRPQKTLVVTGNSERIQDETTENSAWFFNVLGV